MREHQLLELLNKAYQIADEGDNFILNDAGGCKFCWEIKMALKPIIAKIEKDINIYHIIK